MTAGYSGSYGVNGADFTLQPTTGRWMPKGILGRGGAGHPIYPSVREFELRWVLDDPIDFHQIQLMYQAVGNTGTAVVDLPYYGGSGYYFYSYTGCILNEPEMDNYFSQHHTNVFLLVTHIRT